MALPLAATALYAYQRTIDLGRPAALAGALLFAVSGGAIRMLTTPVYVDAVTYLTEAAAFWLLARRQFWPFLAVVTVGVLNRETALLLVALYLVVEPPTRATWKRAALAILLPSAVFGVVVGWKLGGRRRPERRDRHSRRWRRSRGRSARTCRRSRSCSTSTRCSGCSGCWRCGTCPARPRSSDGRWSTPRW